LYGSETWTLHKTDVDRLQAFEMWVWRRMLKIRWTEKKTNDEVLEMVQEERSMVKRIQQQQHNWLGHILRGDSLLKIALEGRMEGHRQRGRQRKKLIDWLMDNDKKIGYKEVKAQAEDRTKWHKWKPEPA